MKQQLNPIKAIGAIVGVLAVAVLAGCSSNNPDNTTNSPTGAQIPAGQSAPPPSQPLKNMSPDDVVKQHMKDAPKAGGQ